MKLFVYDDGNKVEYRSEDMPEYIYYCTNNSRECEFKVNLKENSRVQTAGSNFRLPKTKKALIKFLKKYWIKEVDVVFVDNVTYR